MGLTLVSALNWYSLTSSGTIVFSRLGTMVADVLHCGNLREQLMVLGYLLNTTDDTNTAWYQCGRFAIE